MDSIDNVIENVMQKQIYEPIEFEKAILTAFKEKEKYKSHSNIIIKIISTIVAFITITAGVVFAKDISNFIKNIFNPKTIGKGVVEMAENGYMQNTNMDFIENNGISVKIDNILMDDYNLDIVFEVKAEENIESIYNAEISDLIISDENNNLIYCNYDRVDLYEKFCKEHNIEFSNKNMHNNLTNSGYQTEIIEKTDKRVKFLYKMYSTKYPKSKRLIINFENIAIASNMEGSTQNLKGNWNIEIEVPEKVYNREIMIYNIKDGSDKVNNIILKEAKGSYTEMHITLLMKQIKEPYETTEEGLEKFLELATFEDEIIPTLENEKGKIFERSISSSDYNGGTSYHPNGDVTLYLIFPITKDEYTDTLKLNLTKDNKVMTINLSR